MDDLSWQLLQPLFQSREMAKPALLEQSFGRVPQNSLLPAASSTRHSSREDFSQQEKMGKGGKKVGRGQFGVFFFFSAFSSEVSSIILLAGSLPEICSAS